MEDYKSKLPQRAVESQDCLRNPDVHQENRENQANKVPQRYVFDSTFRLIKF